MIRRVIMEKRTMIRLAVSAALVFSFVSASIPGHACTGIRLETKDGNFIFARTMEFGSDLIPFDLIVVPRNHAYQGKTPSGKPGLAWKTKYAHVGFDPFGMSIVLDGLNEKGLACGSFYFLGYAKFQNAAEADLPRTVSSYQLISWILSTCARVSEVREQMPKIHVCNVKIPNFGPVPIHYMVADETGDAIIIEYVDGRLNIHDNAVNAITNSPDYPWHLTNLRNYISLKAINNPAVRIDGTEFAQLGQGSGAFGLPGDFTPASRFVRAVFFARTAYEGKDVDEGIGIAFHILNQFDIPKGSIRDVQGNKTVSDTTQWTSASDLTNRRYFYHTYHDRSIRMVDFKDVDEKAGKIKIIKDVQKPGKIQNVSGQLK